MTGKSATANLKNARWTDAWIIRLITVVIGVVACLISGWLTNQFALIAWLGFAGYYFGASLFVYASLACFDEFWDDMDGDGKDHEDTRSAVFFLGALVAIGMIWVNWWWFAAIAAVCSFAGPVPSNPPTWWRKLFLICVFAIVAIQLWLNTSLIHLMGSGESLLDNSHVEIQAPLLAALGFGLGAARWTSLRGPNRAVVFVLAFLAFFHGQRIAVDTWANSRPDAEQSEAIASLLYTSKLSKFIKESNHPNLAMLGANGYQRTITTALTPGWLTLNGFPETYYRHIEGKVDMVEDQQAELLTRESFKDMRPIFEQLQNYYQVYLMTELTGLTNESVAQRLARQNFPPLAGGEEPLTRGAIADHVLAKLWTEAPARYQSENGMRHLLNSRRGRAEFENRLAGYQLTLSRGWRYEDRGQMKEVIMRAVDRRVDQYRSRLSEADINPEALSIPVAGSIRLMTWERFTQGSLGMTMPVPSATGQGYTFQHYQRDIQTLFNQNNAYELARGLYLLMSGDNKGTPIKATVMPMIGILISFAFLMTMTGWAVLMLVRKGVESFWLARSGWEDYERDYINKGPQGMVRYLKEMGVYEKISWYGRYWIPIRIWVMRNTLWFVCRERYYRLRLLLIATAIIGFHVSMVGIKAAYLQWQQIPYAVVTETLSLVGLAPVFPSFLPGFLQ